MKRRTVLGMSVATAAAPFLSSSALTNAPQAAATPKPAGAAIRTEHWTQARHFAKGRRAGLKPGSGEELVLHRNRVGAGAYTDPFNKVTRSYHTGTWTSHVVELDFPGDEAVVSWNATTPTGTFIEVVFRGRKADGTWTTWYVMGRWASGNDFDGGDIHRTSVDDQNDDDAAIYTDTFSVRKAREIGAYQVRATLHDPPGWTQSPSLDAISVMVSEYQAEQVNPVTSARTLDEAVELAVPPFAQNTHRGDYPEFGGGGQVWCSPTSSSMVIYHWGRKVPADELSAISCPAGDPQVDYAAINCWDYTYEGSGNWPFNTAYAHRFGLDAFVTRLRSLAEAERFIEAGIPLIMSLNWAEEEMPEAGYGSDGHIMVLIGFTADGDPILNDPAANSNDNVRSVYTRKNYEKVWQKATRGVVYVYRPANHPLPPSMPGLTRNW
ncbi:MAG: C39 family peptidase [Propionibacteriales bacterium]|nr:C39 family peptidase [Propionibacteriales bacterium]